MKRRIIVLLLSGLMSFTGVIPVLAEDVALPDMDMMEEFIVDKRNLQEKEQLTEDADETEEFHTEDALLEDTAEEVFVPEQDEETRETFLLEQDEEIRETFLLELDEETRETSISKLNEEDREAPLVGAEEEIFSAEPDLEEPDLVGAKSGKCGDNLTWKLDDNGILTISGKGKMYDYQYKEGEEDPYSGLEYPASSTTPWSSWYSSIKSVVIMEGVDTIGEYAFAYCPNLASISFPKSLTEIRERAFRHCDSLTSLVIPDGKTAIIDYAFANCGSLKSLYIGSGTEIRSGAFCGCDSLAAVKLSEGVKAIGDSAFWYCTSLPEVNIPESVISIGPDAFGFCSGLEKIRFYGDPPSIEGNSFAKVTATAYYPSGNPKWTADKFQNYGGSLTWFGTKAPKPAKITGLYNSKEGADLRWQAEESAEKYEISRTNGGKTEVIATVGKDQTSYMDSEIKDSWGKVYVYYVRCRAGDNLSHRGDGATLQRLAPMKINYNKNDKTRAATVRWIVSSGSNKANGYELQYAESTADLYGQKGTFKKISLAGRNSMSKTIDSLKKGRTYYFRVRAYVNYTHSVTGVTTKTWSQYSDVKSVKISK